MRCDSQLAIEDAEMAFADTDVLLDGELADYLNGYA